ncbi:hypothetical protein ACLD02_15680 [Alloalcanivorax sp. C16-2]|uniref:hypothetical protein n=1 Tax=Alloalcanivorax TaxID=3020832 RepID=UPI0019311DF4|nr:hypothetical protein [Alloalcanivorax marinus]MBL7252438.1 hypothetical protein [Alloalcanivorax marinus]
MHLVRTLLLALLALAGIAAADDYDYIRGDEIYSEDYNYGLDYDRLRSVPETPDTDLGGAGASPESIGQRGAASRDGQQPSMTRRLRELRQETYPDQRDFGLEGDGDARSKGAMPAVPGR